MQKSEAGSVEHAGVSACFDVSARARDDLPQLGERERATKQPKRLTNSSDHRFLCVGIGVLSNPVAVCENGCRVRQANDGHKLSQMVWALTTMLSGITAGACQANQIGLGGLSRSR